MSLKNNIFIIFVFLIFLSALGVYAENTQQNMADIKAILEDIDSSELIGCCSVVAQLDENNSMMSFRRDANLTADIYIEQIDWNGTQAIKQYKTTGDYFCQVVITSDGWIFGFGGVDDGPDNEQMEKIARGMITKDNSISESDLETIQQMKAPYKVGHFVIKAPNGNYGVATSTSHFTGKLEPGDYIVVPNRDTYFDSGQMPLNTSDKVAYMTQLATSDAFGLARRDITTFDFYHVENETVNGNVTDIYLSNDDGSSYGMDTADKVDNVYLNNTLFKAEDIPIAPDYEKIGNINFFNDNNSNNNSNIVMSVFIIVCPIFVAVLSFGVYSVVRRTRLKYKRRKY